MPSMFRNVPVHNVHNPITDFDAIHDKMLWSINVEIVKFHVRMFVTVVLKNFHISSMYERVNFDNRYYSEFEHYYKYDHLYK